MATLHYPGTPGTALYGGRPKAAEPQPSEGVATTVAVANQSGGALASAPATFGFSFPPGAWQPDAHDIHAAVAGAPLTIQTDATALHRDGSVRFAVVTLDAGAMSAGQTKTIDLTTGSKRLAYTTPLTVPAVNLVAEATIYGVQRTEIICGAYPAPVFAGGETVAVRLSTGGTDYDYSITVAAGQEGGTEVATALAAAINAGGLFRARREGEGNGYTRMTVELMNPLTGGFTPSTTYAGPSTITFNTISTFAAPVLWTAALQTELEAQVASSNAGTIAQHRRRLHGPVVSEFRQVVKFKDPGSTEHAFLTAIFDTRVYADGRRWVDVALENTGLVTASPMAINYKLDIKADGAVVHAEPRFWHYAKARWHKAVWLGGNPQLRVTRDMAYFMTTRMTPNYRLDVGPSGAVLDQRLAAEGAEKSAKAYFGPMACTLLKEDMGATGGRPEIGIVSEWAADYLFTQDDRAKGLMLKAVDDAGAFGVHYRDEATGWPAALDNRPLLEVGTNHYTVPLSWEMVPLKADTAHQGTFGYHPYLATGDAYYLDEMMFWASWNLIQENAAYRFTPGVGSLLDYQLRGTAWIYRCAAELCYTIPEWHPRRQYYRDNLNTNLAYLDSSKGVAWCSGPFNSSLLKDGSKRVDNWQGDFVLCVFGWLLENNEPHAASIIDHLAVYHIGRILADDEGACAAYANFYYPYMVKLDGNMVQTWAEYAQRNWPADYGKACSTLSLIGGETDQYNIATRAALASCANAGNAMAITAHAKWAAMTPSIDNFPGEARKWAIVPRV